MSASSPTSPSLDDIGRLHGTDKSSIHHDFLRLYQRRISPLRASPFLLLEIGVLRGGSLATWRDYLPDSTIVGLDIDPTCTRFEGGNAHVRIGDQSDPSFLFNVISEFGRPKVIIDDGSHRWDHQISTLQVLYPLLQPGGLYIIEDIDTSFDAYTTEMPHQGYSDISAYDYLAKWSRLVVGHLAVQDERPYDLFTAVNYPSVESIELARRTAIIQKREG